MATAPLVLPGVLSQLASGVVLNASLTTSQTVWTCPNGVHAQPMFYSFRNAGAAINAASTVSVGNSTSATAYLNASTVIQSYLTTTAPIWLPAYGSSVTAAASNLNSGDVFKVLFAGTLTSNTSIEMDVVGFIYLS